MGATKTVVLLVKAKFSCDTLFFFKNLYETFANSPSHLLPLGAGIGEEIFNTVRLVFRTETCWVKLVSLFRGSLIIREYLCVWFLSLEGIGQSFALKIALDVS